MMLYQNVKPEFVDPSWWPYIRQRAKLFEMERQLDRKAAAFANRDVAEYYFDEQSGTTAPVADEAAALSTDHGPALRALLETIRLSRAPARIVFRKIGNNGHYGFTTAVSNTHVTSAGRRSVAWIEAASARGTPMHGIEFVLEDGVRWHYADPTANGDDIMIRFGHWFSVSEVHAKDCFGKGVANTDWTNESNVDTRHNTRLAPDVYEPAGMYSNLADFSLPQGATSVQLTSAARAAQFTQGGRMLITWWSTIATLTPYRAYPLCHYAVVTGIDGDTVHFWPGLWQTADCRELPAGFTWAGQRTPVAVHNLEPRKLEGFGIRGIGDARIYNHTPCSGIVVGGDACFGQYITNLALVQKNRGGGLIGGNAIEDVLISDIRVGTDITGTPTRHTNLCGFDKGISNSVIRRISTLDDVPITNWPDFHLHEGVRQILVRDIDLKVDDSTLASWYATQNQVFSVRAYDDSIWLENFSMEFSHRYFSGRQPIILFQNNTSGINGLVNINITNAAATPRITSWAGSESLYPGSTAHARVQPNLTGSNHVALWGS